MPSVRLVAGFLTAAPEEMVELARGDVPLPGEELDGVQRAGSDLDLFR